MGGGEGGGRVSAKGKKRKILCKRQEKAKTVFWGGAPIVSEDRVCVFLKKGKKISAGVSICLTQPP